MMIVGKITVEGTEVIGRIFVNPFGDLNIFVPGSAVPDHLYGAAAALVGSRRIVQVQRRDELLEWARWVVEELTRVS